MTPGQYRVDESLFAVEEAVPMPVRVMNPAGLRRDQKIGGFANSYAERIHR
ncbi:hypothetical protein D3C80_2110780 [compost metagenome]